ncbi:MarR family transcriptional regulator [Mycobacterium sp. TNTM28]|uniref:MarR family transcriptional regulator n=1 Tax=[Mycobacterium] fortunisiensis TaxID=2600579 RepID=A0ABS6KK06_9MYCO|nr:MarR family transcriptional regulator [[Mycobacterium] fortunisiensis]
MVAVEAVECPGTTVLSDVEWQSWESFAESAELLCREINSALTARCALSIYEVHLLIQLNSARHRYLRMGALAEALTVVPSRVTWQVRRLEGRGLVRRFRSREDGRAVVVGITRRGQEYLRPVLRTYVMLVRHFYLAALTRDQVVALGDSTKRLRDGLVDRVPALGVGQRRELDAGHPQPTVQLDDTGNHTKARVPHTDTADGPPGVSVECQHPDLRTDLRLETVG